MLKWKLSALLFAKHYRRFFVLLLEKRQSQVDSSLLLRLLCNLDKVSQQLDAIFFN